MPIDRHANPNPNPHPDPNPNLVDHADQPSRPAELAEALTLTLTFDCTLTLAFTLTFALTLKIILTLKSPSPSAPLSPSPSEPLDNVDAVIGAIRVLTDPCGLQIPLSHVTVSTSGEARHVYTLIDALPTVRLAFSLHAGTDAP